MFNVRKMILAAQNITNMVTDTNKQHQSPPKSLCIDKTADTNIPPPEFWRTISQH
jgi:hypothetical protein